MKRFSLASFLFYFSRSLLLRFRFFLSIGYALSTQLNTTYNTRDSRNIHPSGISTIGLFLTFRLMISLYEVKSVQLISGAWAFVWGTLFLIPSSQPLQFSPTAYEWTQFMPQWVWGCIWMLRGAWQFISALSTLRSKEFYQDPPEEPRRIKCEKNCYYAAYFVVWFSFFMAFGFLWQLRALNGWTVYHLFWLIINAWVFHRLAKRRVHS